VLAPGAARDRLTAGMYVPKSESDPTGMLEAAFLATIDCEPVDEKIRKAVKKRKIAPQPGVELGVVAHQNNIITAEELAQWQRKEALRKGAIKVDDFPQDFGRAQLVDSDATRPFVRAA
jgi:acyl-CoA dehydrogenase